MKTIIFVLAMSLQSLLPSNLSLDQKPDKLYFHWENVAWGPCENGQGRGFTATLTVYDSSTGITYGPENVSGGCGSGRVVNINEEDYIYLSPEMERLFNEYKGLELDFINLLQN